MPEWQFDHLSDGSHLLSASSNIIISNIIQLFLIFSVDWLSLCVEHSIRSHNTEFLGLSCDNLELNWLEIASDNEKVSFLDGSVGILEVWNEESFCEVSCNSFNGVLERKNMNFGEIWDISGSSNLNDVSQPNS